MFWKGIESYQSFDICLDIFKNILQNFKKILRNL